MVGAGSERSRIPDDQPLRSPRIADPRFHDVGINRRRTGRAGGPAPFKFVILRLAGIVAAVAQGHLFVQWIA